MTPSEPLESTRAIVFGPFRLDPAKRCLTRGETPIDLRRKAWDVLHYLSERPGTVVTNDELLDAVWPGVAVTPQTVTNVIHELRLALADTAGAPRWIQTVRGRGHVFRARSPADGLDQTTIDARRPIVVGRAAEQKRLDALWTRAQRGEQQLALITGEPGIGKTTLVDDFASRVIGIAGPGLWHGRGACVEQHGSHEDYLPVLTALEQLAGGPRTREVGALLRRCAPTWLMRTPHLLRPDERIRIEPSLVGATSTRMLREGLALFRALTDLFPVFLIVEDLHWADAATLDLVAALARSSPPSRLLILATFRPVDAAIREHPITVLARELARERHADEIVLSPFDAGTVAAYLRARLGEGDAPLGLATRLEGLSAGNPLFLRTLVDELVEGGAFERRPDGWSLAEGADRQLSELPESLRAFVATEAARLPPSLRRVVEVASVAGTEAVVPELATALSRPVAEVSDACERLASIGRILRRAGESSWHDGTMVGRYAFAHASHRRIVYDALPAHDRQALHRKLALGLEAAYGRYAPEIAPRLAAHFDQGGMVARAVEYFDLASSAAEARFAYGEAAAYLTSALDRLDAVAGREGDRSPHAGLLILRLGELLVLASGYSKPEVERAYARALAIFERERTPLGIFTAEMGLGAVDLTRARYREAHRRTERFSAIAAVENPLLVPIASCWAGFASSALGELTRARGELEATIACDVDPPLPRNFSIARMVRSQLALVLTVQGDLEQARIHSEDALERSRRHGAVSEIAHGHLLAAERAVFLREPRGIETTGSAIALAEANGLVSYLALLRVYDAALHVDWPAERRIAVMQAALEDRARLGDRWHTALLLGLLAEVELDRGNVAGARTHLDEAFAHATATEERYYEAELCRLRAECAMTATGTGRAGSETMWWLERAVEIAQRQGARLWELRASRRLADLGRGTPAAAAALSIFTRALDAFGPSLDTPDVRDGRRFLATLRAQGSDRPRRRTARAKKPA